MEYRLYLMTANGWKYQGTANLNGILFALDKLIEEDEHRQIIVVQHDIQRDMDDTFYVNTGGIEAYLEWKECILKICEDEDKYKRLK